MKAIIGGAIGAAALGGALLLANTRSAGTAGPAATVASTNHAQLGPLSVDCGVGRMALLKPVAPGQAYSQVECVPSAALVEPQAFAQPQGSYLVPAAYPARPAVQDSTVPIVTSLPTARAAIDSVRGSAIRARVPPRPGRT